MAGVIEVVEGYYTYERRREEFMKSNINATLMKPSKETQNTFLESIQPIISIDFKVLGPYRYIYSEKTKKFYCIGIAEMGVFSWEELVINPNRIDNDEERIKELETILSSI
jgi:hypothetical protein